MSVCLITGVGGLVGSQAALDFAALGADIVGIDNHMRGQFFGPSASTHWRTEELRTILGKKLDFYQCDIRDFHSLARIYEAYGKAISVVIHAAAQPSHDWAAQAPITDFEVNALGTLYLLELTRRYAPAAVFIFCSTNKVYGDAPNEITLVELKTRYEPAFYDWYGGISETMRLDMSTHSIFGASKAAADIMVQEYGRYLGLNTVCFRAGCITGGAHSGAEQHGFLAYLMKCSVTGKPYTIYGYKGKQVRDNLHAKDLVAAFIEYCCKPRPGEVYNIGGGRKNSLSVIEAIDFCERVAGESLYKARGRVILNWEYCGRPRKGDHIWYITNLAKFKSHYPHWKVTIGLQQILEELYEASTKRLATASARA